MGKGGTVLGLIGIILGAGGLGFGYFIWAGQATLATNLTDTQNNQGTLASDLADTQNTLALHDIWYSYYTSIFLPPYLDYGVIPNISIVVDLVAPVSLHLLFVSAAKCLPDPVEFRDLFFYFMIDDVRLTSPWTRVGPFEGVSTYEYSSVSLQHFIPVMPPGVYNITVVALSEYSANFIRESTFSITSFPV